MELPAIKLTKEALSRFDEVIRQEWLVTNGLGGYASSTVLGINTRKYHGLLVAALHPPGDRTVCLAKLDEEIYIGNDVYPINANEFLDKVYPQGYTLLEEFSISPFPKFIYAIEGVKVEKTVFMPSEKNAVAAVYRILNRNALDCRMRIYPLLSCRHFHSVIDRRRKPIDLSYQSGSRKVEVTVNDPAATIIVLATEGEFTERPVWIDRLYYREDAARDESSFDDCYQTGYFEVPISPKGQTEFAIVASADEGRDVAGDALVAIGDTIGDVNTLFEKELAKREKLAAKFYERHKQMPTTDWLTWIILAVDSIMVKGAGDVRSVIAGYHWFEAWGRDTFISLPGLAFVTGRFEDARRIFLSFARYVKQGLIPNFITDKPAEPAYNTVDATLWYINAVMQYLKYTGDFGFVRAQLWEKLKMIVASHEAGTDSGIRLDKDGLLTHGPRLTWMDCQVDGKAVTPRAGKAVEVQALWYNTLKTMQLLAEKFDEKSLAEAYAETAATARESFNQKFWNTEKNCLFDVVDDLGADASLRPNQIIAASLEHSIIDKDRAKRVVDLVRRELLTPFGLRTLAPSEPGYKGVCLGDGCRRDQAYHNGTVWPWLLGPFTTAFLKARGRSDDAREFAFTNFLMPLFSKQVFQAGLGTISEIFDGDPPHAPRGCISQAWSVAEPLRAYVEDVLQVRPKHESAVLQL
jgi:predicted glycogen debranching enzyme